MSNSFQTELYKAAALTFEELGFMFPSPELADMYKDAAVEARVSVGFTGPYSGVLVITVRGDLLMAIATNMLGEDVPPSAQQQRDALGEIANVVCGNVLPRVSGTKEVFRIAAPKVGDLPESLNGVDTPSAQVSMALDEGMADIELYVLPQAA